MTQNEENNSRFWAAARRDVKLTGVIPLAAMWGVDSGAVVL